MLLVLAYVSARRVSCVVKSPPRRLGRVWEVFVGIVPRKHRASGLPLRTLCMW